MPAAAVLLSLLVLGATPPADARITRIVLERTESPTFGGARFEPTGPYEKLVGRAFGEVDPEDPANAVIADVARAPRNTRGRVEYAADLYLLRPVDPAKGNGKLLYEVNNRGNKLAIGFFNGTAFSTTIPRPRSTRETAS